MAGPPPRRAPGDRDGFDRRPDPNAAFYGAQGAEGGGGGLAFTVFELVRSLARKVFRRRGE